MKKIWMGSLLAVSVIGLGIGVAQMRRGGASHATVVPGASAAPSNLAGDGPGWLRGARYSYDFSLGLSLGLSSPVGAQPAVASQDRLELSGVLHTTVLARQGERVEMAYEIESPRLKEGAQSPGAAAPALIQSLAAPFRVKFDERGAITSLTFAAFVAMDAQTLLRNLAAALRVPRAAAATPSWTELELDSNGECNMHYACQGASCSKEKLGYVRVTSSRGLVAAGPQAPRIDSSHFGYTTDRHGRLIRMVGKEVGSVHLANAPLRTELSLMATLKSASIQGALPQFPPGPEVGVATAASAFGESRSAELAADLHGQTAASLVAEYMKLDASDQEGRGRSMARLSSLLHHDPTAATEAARLIRAGAPGARLLAEALGGANSAEGQTALASVIGDRSLPDDTRAAAMRASLLIEQPTPALVDSLRSEMQSGDAELRNRARVAFGAGANRLSTSEPELANRMTGELVNALDSAKSPDDRLALLRALGNTGHASAIDSLLKAAGDRDPAVREAAMRALRFCKDPRAGQVLSQALILDPVGEVRRAALFAAEFQSPSAVVNAVAKVAKSDPDNALRGEAIRVLGKLASDNADALQALTDLSSEDADPQLRALAASILGQAINQPG